MSVSYFVSRIMAPVAVLAFQVMPTVAVAQTSPTVSPRVVVAVGPDTIAGPYGKVSETHLAVSNSHVFVVFLQTDPSQKQGYAVHRKSAGIWVEGDLIVKNTVDPSVAYDAANNRFVIAEKKLLRIPITWYDVATTILTRKNDAIVDPPGFLDRSWIMRGSNSVFRQEFWVTAFQAYDPSGDNFALFSHSWDGGATWEQGSMGVSSVYHPEPSQAIAHPSSPVYVSWTEISKNFRFLVGDDSTATVVFNDLVDILDTPIFVDRISDCADCGSLVPGRFPVMASANLAADPTNPDKLYFVYFDVAGPIEPESKDLDVFCVSLNRTGEYWSVSTPVRVNDDINPTGKHSDQVLPDLAVDDAGRVHVVFYDDRDYDQEDAVQDAKFEVYYAYSLDGGLTFTNIKLAAEPDQPALDHTLAVNEDVPNEYPGIATFGNEVWISFAGTWDLDETPDKSVIWVTKIEFGL